MDVIVLLMSDGSLCSLMSLSESESSVSMAKGLLVRYLAASVINGRYGIEVISVGRSSFSVVYEGNSY
jgi:hypothetical protein